MLDFDLHRDGPPARDAATLFVVRDAAGGGVEVFCVERQRAGFLGGAVVFPGGKLDAADLHPGWIDASTPPRPTATPIAADAAALRGLAVAACREALEEAAILPVVGATPAHEELLRWRGQLGAATKGAESTALRELLGARGMRLDLGALYAFARWITPVAESRRFDTRFFLYASDDALTGVHDDRETTASFWARPSDVLRRHAEGALTLAPPTHRTLQVFAEAPSATGAIAIAEASRLEPICPRVVPHRDARGETIAVVLPGDPEHDVREARVPGPSRYVMRDGRFLPEDAPA